jgi:hypothetical protein
MSRINFPKDPYAIAVLSALFTFVLIIIVGVVGFYLGKNQKAQVATANTKISNAQTKLLEIGSQPSILGLENPNPVTLGETNVHNWQGKITKIEDTRLVFRSPYENSLTKGDDYMNITVNLKPDTKFFRLDLTKPLANNEIIYSRAQAIQKSNLKNGQTIIAQSEKDLNLNLEMDAKAIYLINT